MKSLKHLIKAYFECCAEAYGDIDKCRGYRF